MDSICIPNTWYLLSSEKKNNVFFIETNDTCNGIELHQIVIPDGNYSVDQLEVFLNKTYFYLSNDYENNIKNWLLITDPSLKIPKKAKKPRIKIKKCLKVKLNILSNFVNLKTL